MAIQRIHDIGWGRIFNRYLAKGHDHASAAEKADAWEARKAANQRRCVSTHCERRKECASPSDCIGDFDPPRQRPQRPTHSRGVA